MFLYHDPCYLGRANNVYDIPRELIKSLGVELVEMKRSKRKSFRILKKLEIDGDIKLDRNQIEILGF